MSNFGSGYQPADYTSGGVDIVEDDYKLKIVKVDETTSKKGQPMLVVELAIAQASITFRHYIVENEYFDGNMTKFFDCFNIQRGNFQLSSWAGKYGKGHISKGKPRESDGKSFWEVEYLIVEKPVQVSMRPAAPAPQPAKGSFIERPSDDGFADIIPF